MTPVPVPDESMPDAIADEPDTSEIPVLPNSVYAPVRNPRVRWLSDTLEHPTPQPVLPPVVSSQNVPAATPSWSPPLPVTRETPSMQQPVTPRVDICNLSFHRQRPQQMMIPCHFLTLMIHHHGSIRNQRHRGFPPGKIHQ